MKNILPLHTMGAAFGGENANFPFLAALHITALRLGTIFVSSHLTEQTKFFFTFAQEPIEPLWPSANLNPGAKCPQGVGGFGFGSRNIRLVTYIH